MSHNDADQEVLRLIRRKDAAGLRSKLLQMGFSLPPKAFTTSKEALSYIKGFNLKIILGVGPSLRCPFHDDQNPSASVYQANSGDWLLKCHSSTCLVAKGTNILGIVEKLQRTESVEALPFLLRAFNVTVETKNESGDLFTTNLEVLSERFSILAPTAFSLIDVSVLTGIYLCVEHCFVKAKCNGRTNVTFSCTNQRIADSCQRRNLKVSPHLALFASLGILRRVPPYELGEKQYNNLLSYRNMEQVGKWSKPVNCISLFLLTDVRLAGIEDNAKRWKALCYSISTFSFDVVYEKEGSFRAHELFPCGDMGEADESSFKRLKKAVALVLKRELSAHGEIRLNALKGLLVEETGLSKKRVQLSLKPILDGLCQTDYCRVKEGRFTVIRRAFSENPAA